MSTSKEERVALLRPPEHSGLLWSCRLQLALLAMAGFMLNAISRQCMSSVIVCMVNHTALAITHRDDLNATGRTGATDVLRCNDSQAQSNVTIREGSFVWSKPQQGVLLGSFFYGYIVVQFPAAYFAMRLGARNTMAASTFGVGVFLLLSPVSTRLDFWGLLSARVLTGAMSGLYLPSVTALWSLDNCSSFRFIERMFSGRTGHRRWSAVSCCTALQTSIARSGNQLGVVVSLLSTGLMCDTIGWQSLFYIVGAASLLWAVAFTLLMSTLPRQLGRISRRELHYIEHSLTGHVHTTSAKVERVPWRALLSSVRLWALWAVVFGSSAGMYLISTELPTWMNEVLQFDMKNNGLWSSLPYVFYFVVALCAGPTADWLRSRGTLSTTNTRKLFETLALGGQGVFMIVAGYQDCSSRALAVAAITAAQGLSALKTAGHLVNSLDLAPRYAATIQAVSNSIAMVFAIGMPLIASSLTPNGSATEWRVLFWTAGGFILSSLAVYLVWGSGQLQPWAAVPVALQSHAQLCRQQSESSDQEDALSVDSLPVKDSVAVK